MNAKLADALDEAARRIETGEVRYAWSMVHTCNCGILAQVVTGDDEFVVASRAREVFYGSWTDAGREATCCTTGMREGTILRTLGDAGLSFKDLAHLENLTDAAVVREAGFKRGPRAADPAHVIRYMRAWSRLIRREHEQQKSMNAADVIATAHPVHGEVALV